VALVSALTPAREASMVPPTVRVERKRDAVLALVLALLGALAAQAPANKFGMALRLLHVTRM